MTLLNMDTDLISNQIALFFSQSISQQAFGAIKEWLDKNDYSVENLFGYSEVAPEDLPLLQVTKIIDNRRWRVSVARKRTDIFF